MRTNTLESNLWIRTGELEKEKSYWLEQLSGEWSMSGFETDYERSCTTPYEPEVVRESLPSPCAEKVNTVTHGSLFGSYILLLSGVMYLLHRYASIDDLAVGMPIFRQNTASQLSGKMLILRTKLAEPGNLTCGAFFSQVKDMVMEADEHQNMPIEWLADRLQLECGGTHSLFRTVVLMDNLQDRPAPDGPKADIMFCFVMMEAEVSVSIEYNAALYDRESIVRLQAHLFRFFEIALFQPGLPIRELDLLSDEEKREIVHSFNNTAVDYPSNRTVNRLFEEQVERSPHHPAITCKGQSWTYAQLNEKANKIARLLRERGVMTDAPVGLLMEWGPDSVAAIVGILKAGGAYLPIGPGYPEERIRFMLSDSGTKIVLTQDEMRDRISFQGEVLSITDPRFKEQSGENLSEVNRPEELIYIMYTSGSTGVPKGVMVEHKNVIRLVKNPNYLLFDEGERMLQTSSFVFDASTLELWGSLLNGMTYCLVDRDTVLDADKLAAVIRDEAISVMWLTSPLFNQLARQKPEMFAGLRFLLVGGDVLSPVQIDRVRRIHPNLRLINGYGPTENTTFSTCFTIDKAYEKGIPIGRPISNSTAYVFDRYDRLQPVGAAGELVVGGDGVARGYLNRPEMNTERFMADPFRKGGRLYRTGDWVRWLPGGVLEYLGRIDSQIKIRGFRIEPGEIEQKLLEHPEVEETVVLCREDRSAVKYLCAYVVAGRSMIVGELRAYLTSKLPEYMIPARWVQVDRIPLTVNGKVDKSALFGSDGQEDATMAKAFVAPANETEARLAAIWSELLGLQWVGVEDNFFESGGHSLNAAVLLAAVKEEFRTPVSLRHFFAAPTIREVAQRIAEAREQGEAAKGEFRIDLAPAELEVYPSTPAQKRIFIIDRFKGVGTSYHIPAAVMFEGHVDRERLEAAFRRLLERHESLRTSFHMRDGELVQRIHPNATATLDLRDIPEAGGQQAVETFVQKFDLGQAPLVRMGCFTIQENRHLFVMDVHHIAADGISLGILFDELLRLYEGKTLTEPVLQYKDFAYALSRMREHGALQKQEEYWLQTFSGELPVLQLPTDYARPVVQSFQGRCVELHLDGITATRLRQLASSQGATLYMLMLAAINIWLSKYSGSTDIVIGTPVAGRNYAGVQGTVGMFANTLPLRNKPEATLTFTQFLQAVKESTLHAFDNQDYPLEELIHQLKLPRDVSRNPLFDVTFDMQRKDFIRLPTKADGLRLSSYQAVNATCKFDLTLAAVEREDSLALIFQYCTELFKEETIRRMAGHLLHLLRQIGECPDIQLARMMLITMEERDMILTEFNRTKTSFPKNRTLHRLFEEQAERVPKQTALVQDAELWTYAHLNARANQLARALRSRGVGRGSVVGLILKRSPEMIACLLAVLKAGGAYLPIDPESPLSRTLEIVQDAQPSYLLIQDELLGGKYAEVATTFTDMGIFSMRELKEVASVEMAENLEDISDAGNMAYMIYTSGSTGKPKGNPAAHYNISRVVKNTNYLEITSEDTILQLSNYSFDGSAFDIFGALLNGAKLVLADTDTILDMRRLTSLIRTEQVTVFFVTTALFNALVEYNMDSLCGIRKVLFGGERVSTPHVRKAWEVLGGDKLIHVYGPTESTIFATYYPIDYLDESDTTIPIGYPLANTYLYVLGPSDCLQPVGVPGELAIGGEGLVSGYWNRPELTAKKFISDPYCPNSMIYRTGDLAKWLADGSVEFIGRMDNQVKLRGFRIELGEIEERLRRFEGIGDGAVILRHDSQRNPYIAAYYAAEKDIPVPALKAFLSEQLPDYMLPKTYTRMERLPLTVNGKTDKKALPEPELDRSSLEMAYMEAGTPTECMLAELWKELLHLEQVGIEDNFFDSGGNSLLLIRMHARLEQIFGGKVGVADIFANPSIASLSRFIDNSGDEWFTSRITAAGVTFPAHYFHKGDNENNEETLHLSIGGEIREKLGRILAYKGIAPDILLLAMFAYLIYEVTDQPIIPIYTVLSDNGRLSVISPEIYGVNTAADLEGVLDRITQMVRRTLADNSRESWSVGQVAAPPGDSMVALFFSNFRTVEEARLGQTFAVRIHVDCHQEVYQIIGEYNGSRLRKSGMEQLLYGYSKLLRLLVNHTIVPI